ncbi:MAG: DUF4129 domain-containing protein [Myxococcota bacterium]
MKAVVALGVATGLALSWAATSGASPDEEGYEESLFEDPGEALEDEEPPSRPDAEAVEARAVERREEVFASPSYRFCHDSSFGQDGTLGLEFCPLFDADTDAVCPAAREACSNWRALDAARDRRRLLHRPERRESIPLSLDLASLLPQSVAQAIVLAALLVGGGMLLAWVLRRAQKGTVFRPSLKTSEVEGSPGVAELPGARATTLLREAQLALQNGDSSAAATGLHVALLRFLDDTGRIRFHASRTNGDYARRLRGEPELRALFRQAAQVVERMRFGDGQVDGAALGALFEPAARVMSERGPPPTALLALALGLAAGGSTGCGEDGVPAYRFHGPTGMSALPELLESAGLDVSISNRGGSAAVRRTTTEP